MRPDLVATQKARADYRAGAAHGQDRGKLRVVADAAAEVLCSALAGDDVRACALDAGLLTLPTDAPDLLVG